MSTANFHYKNRCVYVTNKYFGKDNLLDIVDNVRKAEEVIENKYSDYWYVLDKDLAKESSYAWDGDDSQHLEEFKVSKPVYVMFHYPNGIGLKDDKIAIKCDNFLKAKQIASDVYSLEGVSYLHFNKCGKLNKEYRIVSEEEYKFGTFLNYYNKLNRKL